jgi:hypothetical protein
LEVSETVFWFVVVPALIVLGIGGLAYAMGGGRRGRRYRPGRPYDFAPVWFLSAPEQLAEAAHGREIEGGSQSAGELAIGGPAVAQGPTGGASDRW